MVIKIDYTSSDIYVSTSVSPVYVVVNYSGTSTGGPAVWGAIVGTLSDQTDLQTALDGKVPYTGATANVNLGEFGLATGQVTLDTTPTGTASVATTRWNDSLGIAETTLKGGNVVLKNGIDLVARVVNKVTPNATLTKAAYQAVRISGAQGQRLAVALAQANNDTNSADTIGLVTETIATNQEGFIMTMGQLENINTTGSLQGETWVDGDVLYLSPTTAGAITKVKPTGAGHIVVIGYVEYAHVNNGKIYVKVMNGWELDELHDVDIVSPANNEALIYESSTALWKNKTIATALGYTPISGSGATGQVAYWNGTNSQTGSNNLFWDAANNNLGIGATPATGNRLHVGGNIFTNTLTTNGGINLNRNGDEAYLIFQRDSTPTAQLRALNGGGFRVTAAATTTEWGRFTSSGNLHLGTYVSDGGQRLQVYGDAFIKGSGATSATTGLVVQDSASANMLRLLNDNTLKLGSQNIDIFPTANGSTVANAGRGLIISTAAASQGTGAVKIVGTSLDASGNNWSLWLSHTFGASSGTATHSGLLLNQTINQTGGANGITRGLYVNPTLTAAADWRSIEWSNNTGWGLYGAGTANNYLAGRLAIGQLPVARRLEILQPLGGNAAMIGLYASGGSFIAAIGAEVTTSNLQFAATSGISFYSGSTIGNVATEPTNERMRLTTAGRLLLGTTTEGTFLLDVNGTARVSGASTFNGNISLSLNQSAGTLIGITNTNGAGYVEYSLQQSATAGGGGFGKYGHTIPTYKIVTASNTYIVNNTAGDIAILNDFASGTIKIAAGASSTAQVTIKANGSVNYAPMATPGTASAGDVYYDSTSNKLRCYNGTSWNDLF